MSNDINFGTGKCPKCEKARFKDLSRNQYFLFEEFTNSNEFIDIEKVNFYNDFPKLSYQQILENITLGSCTCKNGTRTVGCCSHISSIIYYFGYARYLEHIPKPASFLSDIFPNVFRESTDDEIDEPTQGTQNKQLIDKNEWNKAKSIWIVDVLKKTTNQNGVYDLFGDQTEVVDIFLQTQQTYESFLNCPCGRNYSFGGKIISFVKNGTEVSISIKKIKCNRCNKITIVNTKFLVQESGPLFLIINNSSMLELNGSELDKDIEINEEKYLLVFCF
ncbi:unnamed protein product [Brachionus calyciflorus]|uniref:SWIM-type domain-containing protein n=1 Tax=Brachionus calyciflorus TaxID=104777 RepID=A0A814DRQ3_9BILA|nr:unnamed protein product [Brachionus calyciflorus]